MKRKSLLERSARPVLVCAAVACCLAAWSQYRESSERSHLLRAENFVRQHRGPEAEAEWKAVLKENRRSPAAWELLGEYYMSRERWALAAGAFRNLSTIAPSRPHVLCRLAACMLRLDDQKGAFDTANAEMKRDPNCVAALGLVTSLMAERPGTEQKQQMDYQRRLARLLPDDMSVQRMYAEALTNQYLYAEARPVIESLLRHNPHDAEAYNLLGFADLGRPDQPAGTMDAVRDFKTSLRFAPLNGGAHFGLGRAWLNINRPRDAVTELRAALQSMPAVARVHRELAIACLRAGFAAEGASEQARANALLRLAGEERVLMVRCTAYPTDASYPKRLGLIYARLGETERALYYLARAQQLAPGDRSTNSALSRLRAASLSTASAAASQPRQ